MECQKIFVRKNKDNKYGFYYCKVNKFIEGYSYNTVKEANEALSNLPEEELISLIDETRENNEPVDCAERITFKPYKIEDNKYGIRSCDNVVMPYTKSSKEEVKDMLNDDETLKTLKDEYKKRVINTEEASDKLKTNIGKRIIALALTVAFGSGIISLVASMSKKPVINPTNPTISTTNPTISTTNPTTPTSPTSTTRPTDPTTPSSSPETILPNHEKLANNLVGPNLSKDELEKLVMYMNISDYTNTNISISVEDLYTNYTNCIDKILNYDLQNSSKLRLSSVINNTTQKDCLKTIEDYRNKIYSTTDESKLISYYSDLVKYLESNKMNEVTASVSIIAINEMYIYANNFFNDEIFALRDKLIEYTSVNKQDVINECYDVLNGKKLSEVSYTRLLTRI
mgnify:CR=1 FL=1